MSKSQRNKGAAFERQVVRWLIEWGYKAKRLLSQSRDGGADVGWTHGRIECKCGAHVPLTIYKWLDQNEAEIVVVKGDRKQPVAVMYLHELRVLLERVKEGR